MHKYLYQTALILCIVCAIMACASIESIANADSEPAHTFTLDFNCSEVKKALSPALASINFSIKRIDNKTECEQIVIAANTMSGVSWGELVRIHIVPISTEKTKMSVLTKRRLITNLTANDDWSKQVLVAVLKKLESQSN